MVEIVDGICSICIHVDLMRVCLCGVRCIWEMIFHPHEKHLAKITTEYRNSLFCRERHKNTYTHTHTPFKKFQHCMSKMRWVIAWKWHFIWYASFTISIKFYLNTACGRKARIVVVSSNEDDINDTSLEFNSTHSFRTKSNEWMALKVSIAEYQRLRVVGWMVRENHVEGHEP